MKFFKDNKWIFLALPGAALIWVIWRIILCM